MSESVVAGLADYIRENRDLSPDVLREKIFSCLGKDLDIMDVWNIESYYHGVDDSGKKLAYWWKNYQYTPKGAFGTTYLTYQDGKKRLALYKVLETGLFMCNTQFIKNCDFITTETPILTESELETELKQELK